MLNGRDVTERREVDERLRASESRFRGLVQNLAEGVTVLAADGSVKYSSPSASRMMGFELGHGMGKIGLDFVVEEDRERAAEIVGRAFTEPGIQGPIALRVHAANGAVRVVEALGHNRLDDPEVEGIVITTRDITERVQAEEAVRRSDARLERARGEPVRRDHRRRHRRATSSTRARPPARSSASSRATPATWTRWPACTPTSATR